MKEQHHVIYVPGLGDNNTRYQRLAIGWWHHYGVIPHFQSMDWGDGEPFEPKMERILGKVDELAKIGRVSLVGTSAGASAVLNTFARRTDSIHKVVTICGKIQNLQTIQEWRYRRNPAFRDSAAILPSSLEQFGQDELFRILNIYPIWDGVVPAHDAVMEGTQTFRIPSIGHAFSIGCTVLFGAHAIAEFVKS
jgi:pimeloyl-ACP methyl ester carboxylesterase